MKKAVMCLAVVFGVLISGCVPVGYESAVLEEYPEKSFHQMLVDSSEAMISSAMEEEGVKGEYEILWKEGRNTALYLFNNSQIDDTQLMPDEEYVICILKTRLIGKTETERSSIEFNFIYNRNLNRLSLEGACISENEYAEYLDKADTMLIIDEMYKY